MHTAELTTAKLNGSEAPDTANMLGELKPPERVKLKLPLDGALGTLTALPNWVGWRWELVNDKWTMVPYQARNPKRKAASNKQDTWTTYAAAAAAADQFDGIGFVLTNTDVAAFDVDDCRDPDSGQLKPWAEQLMERSSSYTEVTPSGTGIRIIGRGSGDAIHRKLPTADGISCELYRKPTPRYITVTGNAVVDKELADLDAVMDAVLTELEERQPRRARRAASPERATPVAVRDIHQRAAGVQR
jgi:hypothetical protein